MKRRICYVTGTRADFGLMNSTLRAITDDRRLALSVLVTGMHLSERYGSTVHEIEAAGFDIGARVAVDVDESTGAAMARNIGQMVVGFVEALQRVDPDVLLLLGDRGEMLAGAVAGIHLGICIAHLHGGERSGTVDEPVRHAISKLAHLHLVATEAARERLLRMGEVGSAIHVVGAPGLDGMAGLVTIDRVTLFRREGLDPGRPVVLLLYHPVLLEAADAGRQVKAVLQGAADAGAQVMALMPNADAGADAIRLVLQRAQAESRLALRTHLPRLEFVSWMAVCDAMLGNSSSGIIEAASFGTPVVNVGSRQNLRERNANVVDVEASAGAVREALQRALRSGRLPPANVYGDGRAAGRIAERLATFSLSPQLLAKCNAY